MSTAYAAFLLAPVSGYPGFIATVTRWDGTLGLPGGKVELGELPFEAAIRETFEEGWTLPCDAVLSLICERTVEGKKIAWYSTSSLVKPAMFWKEQARGIGPVPSPIEALPSTGLGNNDARIVKAANSFWSQEPSLVR